MSGRILVALTIAVAVGSPIVQAQNIEGQIIASQFGEFQVPSVGAGFSFPPDTCQVSGGGKNFAAFAMGVPVKIVDIQPSHNEVVTPAAVFINSCSVSLATAYAHSSFYLTSGTGGLQEAILNGPSRAGGPNTIILNAEWYGLVAPSNPATVIASVQGNNGLGLVDVTTTPYTTYSWNGTAYTANAGETAGSSGTVTSFSFPNTLGALFTCTLATATTTPAVTCSVASAAADSVYGNFTGSAGAPGFSIAPVFSAINLTDFPTFNQNTTGTSGGLSVASTLPNGTTAATQTSGDNSTKLATDAFVLANQSTAGVLSFNSRAGAVAPASGDYTAAEVTNAAATNAPNIFTASQMATNFTTPQLGTRYLVDGFTTALFPGIGETQIAWTSGTTEPLCQAVSYTSANYIAVAAGNGTVTPGTNSAVWYPVQDANTPTQTDCAFYYTLAAATSAGTSYALEFGSNTYNTPYATAICLAEPALQTQVNLIGAGRGFNNQLTTLKATSSCNNGWVISAPDKSGSLPYNLVISGMNIDAGGQALGCLHIYGEKVGGVAHIGCVNWLTTSTSAIPIVIGDGSAPYQNGGYQFSVDDIFVDGSGNVEADRATVTASSSTGVPVFTISNGGTYLNAPARVYLWGYGNGSTPCTTVGTLSTTYSGSAGSYVLTGITQSGFAGCSGTLYVYVPDISQAPYGMILSLLTDSTARDLVVANAGWKYGIFWNGSAADAIIHEHVYGDSETQIFDQNNNAHFYTEIDSTPHIGVNSGASTTWTDTTIGNADLTGEEENPGVAEFYVPNGGAVIDNSGCGNTTTYANAFSLVVSASGPVAHGASFGTTDVINATECDTLTQENSLSAPLNVPSETVNGGGVAAKAVFTVTGAPYSGGSATTTYPQTYLNCSGATAVTSFSTAGTILGINACSGFAGHLINLFTNGGSTRFRVDYLGNTFVAGTTTLASTLGLSGASAPSITNGAGAGTSPGTPTVTGNNNAGVVTVITGTATPAASTLATVTFNGTLGTTPNGCSLMPRSSAAAGVSATIYTTAPSTTTFTIGVGSAALAASTTYSWSYLCL